MKNSKILKITLIVLISFIVVVGVKPVFADNDVFSEIATNNTSGNKTNNTNTNSNTNSNTNTNTNSNSNVLKTNAANNNTNTVLPATGIGDSIPATVLVVVFGISAVYAYKKFQDYRNI